MNFHVKNISNNSVDIDIRGDFCMVSSSDWNTIDEALKKAEETRKRLRKCIARNKAMATRIEELEKELSSVNIALVEHENSFEKGKQLYREQGVINKVKIISLAVQGIKPASIASLVLKSKSPRREYTKAYISSVYSPKTVEELNNIIEMCRNYSSYLDGVSIEHVIEFLNYRFNRKIGRKEN